VTDPDALLRRAEDLQRRNLPLGRGAPADQAFTALQVAAGADESVRSLAEFVRLVGKPLVIWRCDAAGCGKVVAAVWNVGAGPLLVTGHRIETWSPEGRAWSGRPKKAVRGSWKDVRRHWTPRVALLPGDNLAALLPLPCPDCHTLRTLTPDELRRAVADAQRGAPLTQRI